MSYGLLWCEARATDCMEMYVGNGICKKTICCLDDPEYVRKEAEKERRRRELYERNRFDKFEEKEAAKNIRMQRTTKEEQLKMEIEKKTKRMNRYYTKGWTRLADNMCYELNDLQKQLETLL